MLGYIHMYISKVFDAETKAQKIKIHVGIEKNSIRFLIQPIGISIRVEWSNRIARNGIFEYKILHGKGIIASP